MATMHDAITDFGRQLRPQVALVVQRFTRLVRLCWTRRSERLQLAELDERLLRDIGIDRQTAMREAERPFWDGGDRRRGRWWP